MAIGSHNPDCMM